MKDGLVTVSFIIRRAEFFIPAGILLKCFLEVSDRELYERISAVNPEVSPCMALGTCLQAQETNLSLWSLWQETVECANVLENVAGNA